MPYFNKYPISKNFTFIQKVDYEDGLFSDGTKQVQIQLYQKDTISLKVNYTNQSLPNYSAFKPTFKLEEQAKTLEGEQKVEFQIHDLDFVFDKTSFSLEILQGTKSILKSRKKFVGLSGQQTMFQFYKQQSQPFWGFGSKTGSLNKENQVTKMWNLDVIADHPHSFKEDNYDPGYVSIPFFITKIEGRFFGFYLNNLGQTFFNNGLDTNILKLVDDKIKPKFYFGSYSGESELFIFCGHSFKDIVCKFAKFSGLPDLPPLWSLGKHQCKFSYMDKEEVQEVVQNYQKNNIPLDAIWLDIDYMEDFKSFTWDQKLYGSKSEMSSWLTARGVSLVTMIDPGLKEQQGYFGYDQAKQKDLLCKTYNHKDFVGHVWPGDTVFPDYSLIEARKWWADKIKDYAGESVHGIWIDMNDPATGSVDPVSMLFQKGTVEHHYFHNQYANLMAKATKSGLLQNQPNTRPFILTRSASTGIQRYAAVWTGDNVSNWQHLRMSIPQSINLCLSGVSFNGPDVGGFMDVPSEELMIRWYQVGFLFPFFRNHNTKHTFVDHNNQKCDHQKNQKHCQERYQEPYVFSQPTVDIIKKFINLRYKLLPYIYNLFYQHTQTGAPIIRPLFYDYDQDERYYTLNDQFMIGPDIIQAPIVYQNNQRSVLLPRGSWYDLFEQCWVKGGTEFEVETPLETTKVYLRDGAVIPQFKSDKFSSSQNLNWQNLEFKVYLDQVKQTKYQYYQDDLTSFNYQKGQYNLSDIEIKKTKEKTKETTQGLEVEIKSNYNYSQGLQLSKDMFKLV
jgi:alpha-glucosidase